MKNAAARRCRENWPALRGHELHKVSSKCGIFAETERETLVKTGVAAVDEIIASCRGGRLPKSRELDQGKHTVARGAPASRFPTFFKGGRKRGGITVSKHLGAAEARPWAGRERPRSSWMPSRRRCYIACLERAS